MKELGRGTSYNTHNITSLIRTLKHVSDILQMEEAFTVEEYKHTYSAPFKFKQKINGTTGAEGKKMIK